MFFAGRREDLTLYGEEAEQLRAAFNEKSSATSAEAAEPRLLAFDDFDGKLGLNWKPVRPDPSHVSLTKNPGKLTITTQRGSIHGEETKDEFGEGIQAKNIYLIDNPLAKDADFVATTCVSGFTPAMPYQQAGLIVYDDDDNYLKLGYEFDWHKGEGQTFYCVSRDGREAGAPSRRGVGVGPEAVLAAAHEAGQPLRVRDQHRRQDLPRPRRGDLGRRGAEAGRHPREERREQGRPRGGRRLRVLRTAVSSEARIDDRGEARRRQARTRFLFRKTSRTKVACHGPVRSPVS